MMTTICSYADLVSIFPGVKHIARLEERGEIEYRRYQVVAALVFQRYGRGVIRLATGAGKTLLTALICGMTDKPVLISIYGNALIEQTRRELARFLGEEIGLIGPDNVDVRRVTVASVPTLTKRVKSHKKYQALLDSLRGTDLLIFDEAHHASANSWQAIANKIPASRRLGLSGTPLTGKEVSDWALVSVCGPLLVDLGTHAMQRLGYISEATLTIVHQDYSDLLKSMTAASWAKVRDVAIVNNKERTKLVCGDVLKYMEENPGDRVLVMTGESKVLAEEMYEILGKNSSVGLAHGSLRKNKVVEAFEKLRRGAYRCVIATKLADEGIDVPGVNAIFLVAGGKSYVKVVQRIGRGLRRTNESRPLRVIDYFVSGHRYLDGHCKARKEVYEAERMFSAVETKKGSLFG